MALFFSGAVTSSPIKQRLRSNHSCQSLDLSLLSPDSSYVCYSSVNGDDPCCCRRSPRLLTNGYYTVTEDSFSWDEDGNVSLTSCKANMSYKENPVRVFRRRRRPRGTLARLLSNVRESCQTWLDEKVFRGVFGTAQNQNLDKDKNKGVDTEYEQDQDWAKTPTPLDKSSWFDCGNTELDDSHSFIYNPTEIPPPPDKVSPGSKLLIQEEICSDICQSKEQFTQSLGGLSEVPPPSVFFANTYCCQASPEPTGLTGKAFVLFLFTVFLFMALCSGCLWWSTTVTSTVFMMITTFMVVTKSGPMGEWRRAKTEASLKTHSFNLMEINY
ncbi:transmembrane protein 71 isoform X3 [Channa argus]